MCRAISSAIGCEAPVGGGVDKLFVHVLAVRDLNHTDPLSGFIDPVDVAVVADAVAEQAC